MVKIKNINLEKLDTGIEFMWSDAEEYDEFETPKIVEKLSLILINVKNALEYYEQGLFNNARLSLVCTDDWAIEAMDLLKAKFMEEEE